MVKFWSPAIKFGNSHTWNVVSDITYIFCCLRPYCDSTQEASTHFQTEIRRSIDKTIFLFQEFWKPTTRHPHEYFKTRSTMDGSTAGYAQWHHEAPTSRSHELFIYGLFQQLVPAKADTEHAEEEVFLMKFFLPLLCRQNISPRPSPPSLQEGSYGMVLCARQPCFRILSSRLPAPLHGFWLYKTLPGMWCNFHK